MQSKNCEHIYTGKKGKAAVDNFTSSTKPENKSTMTWFTIKPITFASKLHARPIQRVFELG